MARFTQENKNTNVFLVISNVLQLSDNVKRSKEQAAKNGIWIGLAPMGYMHVVDEQGEKAIVPDPERVPFIVKLFELYATGNYSILKLQKETEQMGLRSRKGQKIAKSVIDEILKNPFYSGMMKTKYGLANIIISLSFLGTFTKGFRMWPKGI